MKWENDFVYMTKREISDFYEYWDSLSRTYTTAGEVVNRFEEEGWQMQDWKLGQDKSGASIIVVHFTRELT